METLEAEYGWLRASVECMACGYRWEAVAPQRDILEGLECPACAQEAGEVPTQAERDEWAGYRWAGDVPLV